MKIEIVKVSSIIRGSENYWIKIDGSYEIATFDTYEQAEDVVKKIREAGAATTFETIHSETIDEILDNDKNVKHG